MTTGRKNLGHTGRPQAGCGHAERGAHSGAAGSDDDDVVGVIDDFVRFRHGPIPSGMPSSRERYGFQSDPSTMRTSRSQALPSAFIASRYAGLSWAATACSTLSNSVTVAR